MAAFTITPENVRMLSTTTFYPAVAGEAGLTPMMPVYLHTDQKYYKAANTGPLLAAAKGLILNYADADDKFLLITGGSIEIGATLSPGTILVVGAAGIIQLSSDNGVGKYVRVLGQVRTTLILDLDIGTTTPIAVV